eukprot:7381263-Prymnesium_polylepis.1
MRVQSSGVGNGDTFDLRYSCPHSGGSIQVSWQYYMNSADAAGPSFRLRSGSGSFVWMTYGTQSGWSSASAAVPSDVFFFEGVRGSSSWAEIRVTDVSVQCNLPPSPPPYHHPLLDLSGFCDARSGTYSLQGTVGTGAPYYKQDGSGGSGTGVYTLFYDLDWCGGGSNAYWWIADRNIDPSRSSNLVNHGSGCNSGSSAHFQSWSALVPVGTPTWQVKDCPGTWIDTTLTIMVMDPPSLPPPSLPPILPLPQLPPSPPEPPPSACDCADTCSYLADGICDDGGPGSQYNACALGTDCTDCSARCSPPHVPPPPPLPPPTPPSPPSPPSPPPPPPIVTVYRFDTSFFSQGWATGETGHSWTWDQNWYGTTYMTVLTNT